MKPEVLLIDIANRFLREPQQRKRGFRDRRAAAGIAFRELDHEFSSRIGQDGRRFVKRNLSFSGRWDTHMFDVGVANATIYAAAQGLSFEVPESEDLEKDLEATAWAVDDAKQKDPKFPVAIVVLQPRNITKSYERAVHIFEGLQAPMVAESEVKAWAATIAARVKPL